MSGEDPAVWPTWCQVGCHTEFDELPASTGPFLRHQRKGIPPCEMARALNAAYYRRWQRRNRPLVRKSLMFDAEPWARTVWDIVGACPLGCDSDRQLTPFSARVRHQKKGVAACGVALEGARISQEQTRAKRRGGQPVERVYPDTTSANRIWAVSPVTGRAR